VHNVRQMGIDFSVGTLNFLANIGIMLPYILMLLKYQQTQSETFLIALVAFYISRAASIFYTKRLNLRSTTYLIVSLVFGAAGSLTFALTNAVGWLIVGSLLWGYSAATIWPYFLTIKLHLSASSDFKMKRLYWAIFLGLGIILAVDLAVGLSYSLTFALLAVLYLAAVPGGILLDNFTNDFYQNRNLRPHRLHQIWRWVLSLIGFAAIAVLTTLRKESLNLPGWLLLTIIAVALLVLAIELYGDRNVLPNYKVRLLNRGFLVSLVLLFNGFFAYFYFGSVGMYVVFALYLVGFETGYPVFRKLGHGDPTRALKYSQVALVTGHLFLLLPWWPIYAVGILLITLYVGYDNPTINATLYGLPEIDSDTAIVHKYRFSTYGGLLCQLVLFGLLIVVSTVQGSSILSFFKPTTTANFWLYTWTLSWPLVLISLGISIGNICHEPHEAQSR